MQVGALDRAPERVGMPQAAKCRSTTCIRKPVRVCSTPEGKSRSDQQKLLVLEEVMPSSEKLAGSLGFTQGAPALKIYLDCVSAKSQLLRRPTVA